MPWKLGTQHVAGCEVLIPTTWLWLRNRGTDREGAVTLIPLALLRVLTQVLVEEAKRGDTWLNRNIASVAVPLLLSAALAVSCVQAGKALPLWWRGLTVLFCVLIFLAFHDQYACYHSEYVLQWTRYQIEPWFPFVYFVLLTRPRSPGLGLRQWAIRNMFALGLVFALTLTVESTPALFSALACGGGFRLLMLDHPEDAGFMQTIRTIREARRSAILVEQQKAAKARRRKEQQQSLFTPERPTASVARLAPVMVSNTQRLSSSGATPSTLAQRTDPFAQARIPHFPLRPSGGFVHADDHSRHPDTRRYWSATPRVGYSLTPE